MSRFRMYPTPEQEVLLLGQCGHARYVWNLGLEQRLMWRRWRGPTPGYNEQAAQLTEARAAFPWLASGSQTVQQQALRDLDQAWANFFAGTHRMPTWRKKGQSEGFRVVGAQALRVRQDNRRWASVLVPKIGWVSFRVSRALPDAKSYRITRDRAGRWHLAFAAVPDPIPGPGTGQVVGVDRGVTAAVALSDGTLTSPGRLTGKQQERRLRLQRRLARQRKGSNRRARTKLALARLAAREADRRKDWVDKTSTHLARSFDVIRVEDLDVAAMTRSAKGTADAPGRNVRAKAGLNRGILANSWAALVARLEHKAPGRVERIPAAYTSQRCAACGHVARENRQSQSVFSCVACGHRAHADINAAVNIAAGRAVTAHGDRATSARSVKREPQRSAPPQVA